MAAPFFASGGIRQSAARLAADAIFQHPQRLGTSGKAVSLHEPTTQYAPRMRRNGIVDGKRRRVGNGTMSPV